LWVCIGKRVIVPLLDRTVCYDIDDIADPEQFVSTLFHFNALKEALLVNAEVGGERNITSLLEASAEGIARTGAETCGVTHDERKN